MINIIMKLSEVVNNNIPTISDFTTSSKYKTLMQLPFFNNAYKTTKDQWEQLNNKNISFTAMFDINLKTAFMEFIDDGGDLNEVFPGRKESDDFDPTDNPTDEYMKQQQMAADDLLQNKDWAEPYLSKVDAHKKPYHFIDPATGKTSGEGPYFGIQFSRLPSNDMAWKRLGFTKAVNGSWFINNEYLKKLVDKGHVG